MHARSAPSPPQLRPRILCALRCAACTAHLAKDGVGHGGVGHRGVHLRARLGRSILRVLHTVRVAAQRVEEQHMQYNKCSGHRPHLAPMMRLPPCGVHVRHRTADSCAVMRCHVMPRDGAAASTTYYRDVLQGSVP